MSNDHRDNIANSENWIKALLILVYGLIFYVAIWVLGLVVLLNLLVLLITGQRNENLSDFGRRTTEYLTQIMAFCTLNSEHHPFPFGDWPEKDQGEADDESGSQPPPPAAEKKSEPATPDRPPPVKKTPVRKKSTRKKKTGSGSKKSTAKKTPGGPKGA